MEISIFEALSRKKSKLNDPVDSDRGYSDDGQLTMHDDIFKMQLKELNLAQDIIDDLMLEPADQRDNFLEYFRSRV